MEATTTTITTNERGLVRFDVTESTAIAVLAVKHIEHSTYPASWFVTYRSSIDVYQYDILDPQIALDLVLQAMQGGSAGKFTTTLRNSADRVTKRTLATDGWTVSELTPRKVMA